MNGMLRYCGSRTSVDTTSHVSPFGVVGRRWKYSVILAASLYGTPFLRKYPTRMPIVTMFGLDFAVLLGGAALVTETVFNLPGIGQYEAQAIGNLDVPPILVGAMFTAFFVVLFSAFNDIVYALLDPRVRLTG